MWQTGTATDYQDLLTKLVGVATSNHVETAVVSAAGTGYTVGDTLTATGGTFTFAATFVVTAVAAGLVTALRLSNGGAYTVNPGTPVSTTGGTGTGCTVTVTFLTTGWTAVRNTTPGGEKEVILQGSGGGSDSIYVGIKTYQILSQDSFTTAYNWVLTGMTGFNTGLTFTAQPNVSPGADPTVTTGGAYVPLKTADAFPISFWFNITSYRIIMVALVENAIQHTYVSCYLGWMNRYGTSTEQPYPIFVAGSSGRNNALWSTTNPTITGLTEFMAITGRAGPAFYRSTVGVWTSIFNSNTTDSGSPSRTANTTGIAYPAAVPSLTGLTSEDQIVSTSNLEFVDFIPATGIPGVPAKKLQDTGSGPHKLMIPVTVIDGAGPTLSIIGEVDDIFWFSGVSSVANQDTLTQGTNIYRVFQNGNRAQEFSFMAVREY